jgi:4'-phosphopantetheinyl transferase
LEFERKNYQFDDVQVFTLAFGDFDPIQYLDRLTTLEKERFFTFSNLKRKQEFVATRLLRHEVIGFQHIHYNNVGAPYIDGEGYISISHTRNLVGFALCKTFQIGLDLELIQDKIIAVKHKFISESEKQNFEIDNCEELTKIWSAKETLYKLSGLKGLNFRTELELNKISNDIWKGYIKKEEDSKTTTLKIHKEKNVILTLNISACEK